MMLPGEIDLMPFQEQLDEYPGIKELLLTKPPTGPYVSPPWRVYVRKTDSSGWARKDFETYKGAFDFFRLKRKIWYDVSITSKQRGFTIPGRYVKIKRQGQPVMIKTPTGMRQATKLVPIKAPPGHLWCKYCRRFTVFTYFLTHHAFKTENQRLCYRPSERRCCVCGITEYSGAHR